MGVEKALEMVLKEKTVTNRIKNGIYKTKYELYPDCRAILYIFTNRQRKLELNDSTKYEAEKLVG